MLVAERLDVALARTDDVAIDVPAQGVAVPLRLTNTGNGREAFDIAARPSDASVAVRLIAIDADGDGRFDPAVDTVLADRRTPSLDAGETMRLVVLLDPAAERITVAALSVEARAATGSGPAGTGFAKAGDGGGAAVTGQSGALAAVAVPIGVRAAAVPVLSKSQSVRAPDGSSRPVTGAVVTYRLEARFAGSSSAARIDDPIPPGTAYLPGSLMLDAVRLTDAADDDAGRADGQAISVALGAVGGFTTHTVQFQVTIR